MPTTTTTTTTSSSTWLARFARLLFLVATIALGATNAGAAPPPHNTWTFDTASSGMAWTPLVDTDITVATSIATSHDLLVVVVPHNTTLLDDEQEDMVFKNDTRTAEAVKYLLTTDDVKSVIRYENAQDSGGGTVTRLLVVELPANEDNAGVLGRKVAASVVSALKSEKAGVKSCGIQLSLVWGESTGASADFLSECTCSIMTGLYNDRRYKGTLEGAQKNAKPSLKWIEFITPASSSKDDSAAATKAVEKGAILARGVYLSKDIVNAPHNSLNSYGLATTARKVASQSRGRLSCQILEQADIEKRGMGAFLGVARGSETYPKLIHLTYKPKKKGTKMNPLKKLGVVGKGLLFDTGGYSIKTQMMELMKFDCGGAAAVLGAAQAIAALQPEGVEVHFVIAACENMINERAVVPGDILTAANGKTIEVINTDAEGRLTMADALVYIDKEVGCERIIELSTLTGSCIGALGSAMAGIWTEDEGLLEGLQSASKVTGEKLWHLPLEKEYNEQIKSKIADLKNIGGRYAGAITAALFLTNFVDNKPFAHIDMAGPVWSQKLGATGWGAKLVTEWVCQSGK